jgi:AAA+ ATPase superfamily predicted ATPase
VLKPLRARDQELSRLLAAVDAAAEGGPQLVMVRGLRRVGKSFLLQHLLQEIQPNAVPVYFEATQAGEGSQLRRFTETLRAALGPDRAPPVSTFPTWEAALDLCAYLARSTPLVVVIDEATYLMAATPGFTSLVQVVWDRISAAAEGPALTLALAGSAVGIIEDALGYRGALYQRPTLDLRLQPFTAAQASVFLARPDPVALFEAYAACGGYPLHLDAWDFERSVDDNLAALAGTPGGLLVEDGAALLASLPDAHRRVLMAVGQGRTRRGEIINEVGARVDRPLDALVQSGLVRAARPLGSPHQARPEYRVTDPYLRFWLRRIADHVQRIEAGQGSEALRATMGEWQAQLGFVFEQAAREHAVELVRSRTLPPGTLVDEWWSQSGEPCQVDVLGLLDGRTVAVGEARWQRQPLGRADVERLLRALRRVPDPVAEPRLLLWGRGGVRPDSAVGPVLAFGPSDILGT